MLKHHDIWRAIDRLADLHGLSPSGLARKAGLSATLFNPSKRVHNKRERWPSTESIAAILKATHMSFDSFVALTLQDTPPSAQIPLLGYGQAGRDGFFDDAGYPKGHGWDAIPRMATTDPHAFALEISGQSMLPVYRDGDKIIVSPAEKWRRGDRVAVRTLAGEVMIKTMGLGGANKIELLSFHPDYPPITLARRDIAWIYRIIWASQ